MKKILLFALMAFFTLSASGQAIVTDSVAPLFLVGNIHFQTRYIIHDNGESEIITTRIGDSTTVENFLFNQARDAAIAFTESVRQVLRVSQERNKIRDLSQAMQTAIGANYFALTRELYYTTFVDTIGVDKAWQWRAGAATPAITPLNIRKLANGGNLRVAGLPGISSANRNIDFMGPGWIRIQNYPATGEITELYELVPGRWFNPARTIELRLTGLQIRSSR